MSDLGQLLRRARLENKISLEDLQETTKIRKRYLEAIEEGNYKVLPGSFYVRAFIKSYAESVGLDPNEVLKLYQSYLPETASEKPAVDTIRKKRSGSTKNTDKLSRIASSIVMISFVVLILGVIYYYAYQNYKETPADDKPSQSQAPRITDSKDPLAGSSVNGTGAQGGAALEPLPIASPTPTPTPTPIKTEVTFSSNEKGVDHYLVKSPDKLNIQFKITGVECWIQVDAVSADNKKTMQKQKVYKLGDTDAFELESSAYLNIGAASNVELTVNGTIITVGDTPNPKRIQLNLQKN